MNKDDLPGMLAAAKGVAEQTWPHTMDAQVWAKEFARRSAWPPEDVMIGWFANAIMAGYDTANSRAADAPSRCRDEALEEAAKAAEKKSQRPFIGEDADYWNAYAHGREEAATEIRALKIAAPQAQGSTAPERQVATPTAGGKPAESATVMVPPDLMEALRAYKQADHFGVDVRVSREALDKAIELLAAAQGEGKP